MSVVSTMSPSRSRPALKPIALPAEHGGWGFLFEPIVLALAVAPSAGGAMIGAAFVLGFLVRQPLKLALQDALRGRSYPRTPWCWGFAAAYALAAAALLSLAVMREGPAILIAIGLAAPLAFTQILYDAGNRGRHLLPELAGAAAMTSSAAAIAIAGGMRIVPAFALAGILVARFIPAILYVRTLLLRSHGKSAPSWAVMVLHAAAIAGVAIIAPPLAALAMVILFARAAWGLTHPVPRAKTIGWREIAFGAMTLVIAVLAYQPRM
ncbi:MAG TPA: YwiC-like family protein [Thermoanaerobaculia bacterium]|nr:YwiC-like family protein [Thermoanaerobaculia bacterium]